MAELGRALGVREDETGDVEMGEANGSGNGGRKAAPKGSFEQVQRAVEKIVREGYSAVQVLSQVRLLLLASLFFDEKPDETWIFCSCTTS